MYYFTKQEAEQIKAVMNALINDVNGVGLLSENLYTVSIGPTGCSFQKVKRSGMTTGEYYAKLILDGFNRERLRSLTPITFREYAEDSAVLCKYLYLIKGE